MAGYLSPKRLENQSDEDLRTIQQNASHSARKQTPETCSDFNGIEEHF